MATTTNTRQRRSDRRAEILAVAARVIAERGLAGATVRDIGEAAGILSGSLYHHFESKEQIVLDLLIDTMTARLEESRKVAAEAPDAATALADIIRRSVEQTAETPHQSLILRNETHAFAAAATLAPLAELRRQTVAVYVGIVERGIESGDFAADLDAEATVMSIVDAVLGAARWFDDDRAKPVDAVADTLVRVFLTGLAGT